jgi:hypothetical protein
MLGKITGCALSNKPFGLSFKPRISHLAASLGINLVELSVFVLNDAGSTSVYVFALEELV